MSNLLLWLLTVEGLGLAAFPLLASVLCRFPDRGWGLSKVAGLLIVGFVNWWLGSITGLGNDPALLWVLALLLLAAGLAIHRQRLRRRDAIDASLLLTVIVEELLFLAAFCGWTLVRMQNPDIYSTEKPMDFMLLQVSSMTHTFPPPDAWLSGHTVNYYYLGYALFAMLGRMAGVDPRYGYNLATITIFALGCAGAYAIALAMLRDRRWALGGPLAVMLAGDLDGVGQVLTQIQNQTFSWSGLNLWCSTRIIGGGCANYRTITEFPIFSMLWNDLHPHVMAIPFALLAIALALHLLKDDQLFARTPADLALRLGAATVVTGALYPINSWDYPTYTLLVVGCALLGAWRAGTLTRRTALLCLSIIPAGLLCYLPYYLTVHLAGDGVGVQVSPTDTREFLTVIGALVIPAVLLALWRFGAALLTTALAEGSTVPGSLPRGWGYVAAGAALLLFAVLPGRTDLLLLLTALCAAYALVLGIRDLHAELLFALALTTLGVSLLFFGDYVYLKDIFAASPQYRLNTVFKIYYQAWLLLGVVPVFVVAELWRALPQVAARLLIGTCAALLALAMLVYPLVGIPSQPASQGGAGSLDGLAYLEAIDLPEYGAVQWIRTYAPPDAVVAEAGSTGVPTANCGEYWVCAPTESYDKISALTGRPTLVGWPGSHESLWREASTDPAAAAMLATRETDLRTLYTTTNVQLAMGILQKYHVSYVYVGPVEEATYSTDLHFPPAVLSKFSTFLRVGYTNGSATVYIVPNGT